MKLGTLCSLAGLETPTDAQVGAREICAVTCNSRACVPGCIYVCIAGMRVDGHAFIEEALAKGAAAVVTERDHPSADGFVGKRGGAIFLSSDNTRTTAARLFHAWYGKPDVGMKVFAITGTNGKTSTALMLREIFTHAGHCVGLIGTLGCYADKTRLDYQTEDACANMTTPDPEQLYQLLATMRDRGVDTVVMEASSHALALHKLEPLHVDVALFTNFSQDHLDFHGTMEAYLNAKAMLLEKAPIVILNGDDAALVSLRDRARDEVRTVSATGQCADVFAEDVRLMGADGVAYTACANGERTRIGCPMPGDFTVANSLLACAGAAALGVSMFQSAEALKTFSGVKGRMERVAGTEDLPFSVLIDYAHTPDALEKLLLCARGFCQKTGKIRLLFGCGGDRDRSKRAKMARVAAQYADVLYVTGDNSRSEDPQAIIGDILSGIPEGTLYHVIPDRAAAITRAMDDACPQDIILLAGKGHETYEINRTGRHPFDERVIVRQAATHIKTKTDKE